MWEILKQLSLNSCYAQVQTLFLACFRFAMVRISDNGPRNKARRLSSVSYNTQTIHHHHYKAGGLPDMESYNFVTIRP